MEENNTPASGMQLLAQKAKLVLSGERELLSAGMAGVVQVSFTCSEDWDGLSRIAVFSNGAVSVDVPESEWDDGVCTVPREVLERAGKTVLAGLYGTDGEHVILPTVWCSLGRVEAGTVPACQLAAPAGAPLWAQLLGRIEALEAQPPSGYQPPDGGIPLTDLAEEVQSGILSGAAAYQKPSGGIPENDLESAVQAALAKANSAYQKPIGGISWEDLHPNIMTSLGKADTAYQKPSAGIPLNDISAAAKAALGRNTVTLESYLTSSTQFFMSMSMSDIYAAYQAGGDVFIRYEDPINHEKVDCRLVRIDGFDYAVFAGCKVNVNTNEITAIVFEAMNDIAEKFEIELGGSVTWNTIKPAAGIPESDLSATVQAKLNSGGGIAKYTVTFSGTQTLIPSATAAEIYTAVQAGNIVEAMYDGETLALSKSTSEYAVFVGHNLVGSSFNALVMALSNSMAVKTAIPLQSSAITDTGGYFTSDTVEGALQEIGFQLDGLADALEALL